MDDYYKYDNSLSDFCEGIASIQHMFEKTFLCDMEDNKTYLYLVYCHILTLIEAYIGRSIRYYSFRQRKKRYEFQSFLSRTNMQKYLHKELNISINLPDNWDEIVKTRNLIIHRNGIKDDSTHVKIKREDINELLCLARSIVCQINSKILNSLVTQSKENIKK